MNLIAPEEQIFLSFWQRNMMIATVLITLATLSTAFAEPPSSRYLPSPSSNSGNQNVDITEAKARGFSGYSDSSFDTTGFGSGPSYSSSSPSTSQESYSSHSNFGSSSSNGYSGSSSPVTYGSQSFGSASSGFTPSTYGPSLSFGSGGSSGGYSSSGNYGGNYSPSLGYGSGATRGQGRPIKPTPAYGAPSAYTPGPSYGTPLSHNDIEEQADPSDPVKYEFAYEVIAPESGSEFGHRESRSGGVTTGQYHVLLPDGRVQTVEYLADKAGYRPTVTYQQTDRLATPSRSLYGRVPSGSSPTPSSGYGSLSVPQTSHGSPVIRGASHSSYSPNQRQSSYSSPDFHSKASERILPNVLSLTEKETV